MRTAISIIAACVCMLIFAIFGIALYYCFFDPLERVYWGHWVAFDTRGYITFFGAGRKGVVGYIPFAISAIILLVSGIVSSFLLWSLLRPRPAKGAGFPITPAR